MFRIVLDTAGWENSSDFYEALLPALGAPDWHGRNLDALLDSLSSDDINAVSSPLTVELLNTGALHDELRTFLEQAAEVFGYARERGSDVEIILAA